MKLSNMMKNKQLIGLLIIFLLCAGSIYPSWRGAAPTSAHELSAAPPPLPGGPATVTVSTSSVITTSPAFNWSQPPLCQNQPLDLAAWRSFINQQLLDNPEASVELGHALAHLQSLTPVFQNLDLQSLLTSLDVTGPAGSEELVLRELILLWLNVSSGRLNRATELKLETQPDIQTVDDLLVELGQALTNPSLAASLVEASQELQIGQHISRHVCGRLAFRTGPVLHESVWAEDGHIQTDTLLPDVPAGVTSFPPDYTKLIIETPAIDTGGGPVFLFDLETGKLANLSQQFEFLNYQGLLGLTVAGWHPDGQHLLLFDQDNNVVLWANLDDYSYQRIPLGAETTGLAPARQVALIPDGSAFIYIADGPEGAAVLTEYSLTGQSRRVLATLETGQGRLSRFRISPDGDRAAYTLRQGKRSLGVTYDLMFLDVTQGITTTLVEESLVQPEPVWSPNGQKLAFIRKIGAKPAAAGRGMPSGQGDIWVATPATGDLQQMTFVEGINYPPVWSADSRFLAFVSQNGEVGLASIEQPGVVWSMGASLSHPEFSSIVFIP
jgi:hypothetical protein